MIIACELMAVAVSQDVKKTRWPVKFNLSYWQAVAGMTNETRGCWHKPKLLLYSPKNLIRRMKAFMREFWKQFLLLLVALAVGPLGYTITSKLAASTQPLWERMLLVLAILVPVLLFLTFIFGLLWLMYRQDNEQEKKRWQKLDNLTSAIERLIQRMDDGRID
jgi:uncharacterized BrkB/YihY/UPF0761 family membrane protein